MLQSPNSSGPPSLSELKVAQRTRIEKQSLPPLKIGTHRVVIHDFEKIEQIVEEASKTALNNLDGSKALFLHVTFTSDLDSIKTSRIIEDTVGEVPWFGRSIVKDDTQNTVEFISFGSDDPGVQVSTGEFTGADLSAIKIARTQSDRVDPEFMVFASTPNCDADAVRGVIYDNMKSTDFPIYGGPAQGGDAWSLAFKGNVTDDDMTLGDKSKLCMVSFHNTFVPFLLSSVIKNWTQPKYVKALEFLVPKYTGDPESDLLVAIKFDDWDKFVECIEVKGVDVNHKWVEKLNQSPFLAAASRARMEMMTYLIDRGANVNFENDGGYNAYKYTLKLKDIGEDVVAKQMKILKDSGAELS